MSTAAFPVIDGHNDLAWRLRDDNGSSVEGLDTVGAGHTDLPRLRAGGVVGQFWSVYVDTDETDPVAATLAQVELVHRLVARYPEALRLARTAAEVREAMTAGRIASLLGAEGGHSIGDDLGVLRELARRGVRSLALTHNADTSWADSAAGSHPHGGITGRGREIIAEMERLGVLVDLSHVSVDTMSDALDVATAPVIFSHSGVAAVHDHPRNVPDAVLERLPANGGVVMLTFVPAFVSASWHAWVRTGREGVEPAVTVADVADHIDHAREVAGVESVGLGGDFDGTPALPPELRDVSRYPVLAQELRRRGWSPAELRALAGGNILRVLEETDPRVGASG